MKLDIMRVPYNSNFYPDPPSDFFDMFQRASRELNPFREIPVFVEPSPHLTNSQDQTNRASALFNGADIPGDFWEPVSPDEVKRLRRNNKKSYDRNQLEDPESPEGDMIDLCDGGECGVSNLCVNNNGVKVPSRRRSLSKSGKRNGSKAEELHGVQRTFSSMTNSSGPSEKWVDRDTKSEVAKQRVEKDLEEAFIFKPTLEKENKDCKQLEYIDVDSEEEAKQLQNLCDFFESDSSIHLANKTSEKNVNIIATPSYPAYDIIKAILDKEGRCVDYIRGDGNCFFRALSKVIYGTESCHRDLRQAVVDLLETYPKEFEQFIDDSVGEHIKSMRKPGTWATQAEIYITATLLQRDIYVLSPDHTGDVYRWLLFSPRFAYKEASVYDQCYITLCHTNGNHYDRIASVEKKCNCYVPPPQMMGIYGEVDLTDDVV